MGLLSYPYLNLLISGEPAKITMSRSYELVNTVGAVGQRKCRLPSAPVVTRHTANGYGSIS